MNQEERLILDAVNLALKEHGSPERFAPHPFFPATRTFTVTIPGKHQTVRIWPSCRRLDIFTEASTGPYWGYSRTIGNYTGTHWLPQLAQDAVDTITSPPKNQT